VGTASSSIIQFVSSAIEDLSQSKENCSIVWVWEFAHETRISKGTRNGSSARGNLVKILDGLSANRKLARNGVMGTLGWMPSTWMINALTGEVES